MKGGEKMELTAYRDLEQILLYAIKMPTIKIRQVAEETGLGIKNLYRFTSDNHIGAKSADILLDWFKEFHPDLLELAIILYRKEV